MATPVGERSFPSDLPGGVTRGLLPKSTEGKIPSENEPLDALLGGGFPRGQLSEVFGPLSSGRTSLAYSLLATATSRGEATGIVDHACRFDPASATAAGIRLSGLLWVRPQDPKQALRCTEILLGTRGFALVVLDLADDLPAGFLSRSASAWTRLARRTETSRTALVLLAQRRLAGSFAHLSLSLSNARPLWADHPCLRPHLLAGLETRVEVVRTKQGTPGREARVSFGTEPA